MKLDLYSYVQYVGDLQEYISVLNDACNQLVVKIVDIKFVCAWNVCKNYSLSFLQIYTANVHELKINDFPFPDTCIEFINYLVDQIGGGLTGFHGNTIII